MQNAKLSSICLTLILAGGVTSALSIRAQDVLVNGTVVGTPLGGGEFAYTLTLNNTGTEAVQSLWLGWALDSANVFNVDSPSAAGNSLGWANNLDGNSIQFAGTSGTALASLGTATFTFDSTSTPAQFMAPTGPDGSGLSVAYGVLATQFAIEDTTLHSFDFAPTLVSAPEPSTFGLLALGSLGLWGARRRRKFRVE